MFYVLFETWFGYICKSVCIRGEHGMGYPVPSHPIPTSGWDGTENCRDGMGRDEKIMGWDTGRDEKFFFGAVLSCKSVELSRKLIPLTTVLLNERFSCQS